MSIAGAWSPWLARWRGILSGILAERLRGGLLCWRRWPIALPFRAWGWRPMFWLGGVPRAAGLVYSLECFGIGGLAPPSRAVHVGGFAHCGTAVETVTCTWSF